MENPAVYRGLLLLKPAWNSRFCKLLEIKPGRFATEEPLRPPVQHCRKAQVWLCTHLRRKTPDPLSRWLAADPDPVTGAVAASGSRASLIFLLFTPLNQVPSCRYVQQRRTPGTSIYYFFPFSRYLQLNGSPSPLPSPLLLCAICFICLRRRYYSWHSADQRS